MRLLACTREQGDSIAVWKFLAKISLVFFDLATYLAAGPRVVLCNRIFCRASPHLLARNMLTLLTIRVLFGLVVLAAFLAVAVVCANWVAWTIGAMSLREKGMALDPASEGPAVTSARRSEQPAASRRKPPAAPKGSSGKPHDDNTTSEFDRLDLEQMKARGEGNAGRTSKDRRKKKPVSKAQASLRDPALKRIPREFAVDDIIPLEGPVLPSGDDSQPIERQTPPPMASSGTPAPVNPA